MISERESPSFGSMTKHFFPRTYNNACWMKIINSNELSVQYCYSEKAIKIKIVDDQNLI